MQVHRAAVLPEDRLPVLLHVVDQVAVPRQSGIPRVGGAMTPDQHVSRLALVISDRDKLELEVRRLTAERDAAIAAVGDVTILFQGTLAHDWPRIAPLYRALTRRAGAGGRVARWALGKGE